MLWGEGNCKSREVIKIRKCAEPACGIPGLHVLECFAHIEFICMA